MFFYILGVPINYCVLFSEHCSRKFKFPKKIIQFVDFEPHFLVKLNRVNENFLQENCINYFQNLAKFLGRDTEFCSEAKSNGIQWNPPTKNQIRLQMFSMLKLLYNSRDQNFKNSIEILAISNQKTQPRKLRKLNAEACCN